jgi:hypothetical protein
MDANTNSILSVIALVFSVGGTIIGIINHKRIVSKCCGRKADLSLDIQDTRVDPVSPQKTAVV